MLCKKCGSNIADTSKFCGYCGNPVEKVMDSLNEVSNNINSEISNSYLDKTTKIDPVIETKEAENFNTGFISPIELESSNNVENKAYSYFDELKQNIMFEQNSNIENPVNTQKKEENNKKGNKVLFIILGIVLTLIAIIVVVLAFNKSTNTPINVLKKSLANLEERIGNSVTLDAKLSMATPTGETFNFSGTIKYEEKNDDREYVELSVNKSLFFDEINAYAKVNDEEVTLYAKSTLVDMLGFTYSEKPIWIYFTDIVEDDIRDDSFDDEEEIKFIDLIDENHFIFVEEINELMHYQLIIDKDLANIMKQRISNINDQDIKDMIESIENIKKPIKVDFYINKYNELKKLEIDLTEHLDNVDEVSSMIVSVEISGLNSTKVEIPIEAENSVMDLENYMSTYITITDDLNYNEQNNDSLENNLYTNDLNNVIY